MGIGPGIGPKVFATIGVPLAVASCIDQESGRLDIVSARESSMMSVHHLRDAWEDIIDEQGVDRVFTLADLRSRRLICTADQYDVYSSRKSNGLDHPESGKESILFSPDMFAGPGETVTIENEEIGGRSPSVVMTEDGYLLIGAYMNVTGNEDENKDEDERHQYRVLVVPPEGCDQFNALVYSIDLQPGDEAFLTPTGVTRIKRRKDKGIDVDRLNMVGRTRWNTVSLDGHLLRRLALGKILYSYQPDIINRYSMIGPPQLSDGTVIWFDEVVDRTAQEIHPIFLAIPPGNGEVQYIDILKIAESQAPESWGRLRIEQTDFVGMIESTSGEKEAAILSMVRNEAGDVYILTTTYGREDGGQGFTYKSQYVKAVSSQVTDFKVTLFDPDENTIKIELHPTSRGSGPVIMRLGGGFGPLVRADTGQRTQYAILHPPLSSGTDTVHRPRKPTDYPPHQGKTVGRAPWHGNTPASGKPPKPYNSTKPIKHHRRPPRPRSQV